MPQKLDGIRIEPAPSEPWWSGPSPASTAAAAPALERPVAERLPAELGARRLADEDAAGLTQARDEGGVGVRHAVLEDERAAHRAHALGEVQVLDRVGRSEERRVGKE